MLNSGVSDHDLDVNFYTCIDEEEVFKNPGTDIRCIPLTEENILFIKNAICKFNKDGVYNNLQILAVYGEPWSDESLLKLMTDLRHTLVKKVEKRIRKGDASINYISHDVHPEFIAAHALKFKFRRVLIRVSGKGSRYCHHIENEHINISQFISKSL